MTRLGRPGHRGIGLALGAALLASLGTTGTAAAAAADVRRVELPGVVRQVIIDPPHVAEEGHAATPGHDEETWTELVVEVGGGLVTVPDADAGAHAAGDPVTVTLSAPAGATTAEALAAVSELSSSPDAAGVSVDLAPSTAPRSGVPDGRRLTTTLTGADSPAGQHRLTVLPVYWTAPDTATQARLRTVAGETAQYWSEQSAGAVTVTTDVRAWARIADPGTCDVAALYNRALAAHGLRAPSGSDHVAIYFPRRPDCGSWAGQAMVGGPVIWVNGYDRTDVLAHELGHNFGLGHANQLTCTSGGFPVPLSTTCTQREYQDRPDVMGYSDGRAPGSLTSALADDLGLLRAVDASPTAAVTVDLAPLTSADRVRAVRIPTTHGTVYVDFRPAAGRDTRYPAWAGVQVHRYETRDGIRFSQLLDMQPRVADARSMPEGASWDVPGSAYTLTVLDVADGAARVRVAPQGLVPASPPPPTTEPVPVSAPPVHDPAPPVSGPAPPASFSDVPTGHVFFTEIGWLSSQGITQGYPDGSFGAGSAVARQAMAAFLYRFSEATVGAPASARFTDVATGHPFHRHVEWLAATGITRGLPDGSFGAVRPVTRDAMAAFLYRLAGSPAYTAPATARFSDVPVGHPFYREVSWLAETGITTGYPDGSFGAALPVARQAMAAFLYRYDARFGSPTP